MQIVIGRHFSFEASHQLPDKECYGKCRNVHGHRYELEVQVAGEIDENGWICDFSELKDLVVKNVLTKYDHAHLNDFFAVPTAENIAITVFKTLREALRGRAYRLCRVRLYETAASYAEVIDD